MSHYIEKRIEHGDPLSPDYRCLVKTKWDRHTKTFSATFSKDWFATPETKIELHGIPLTQQQADIRKLQEMLSEIALTGDLT